MPCLQSLTDDTVFDLLCEHALLLDILGEAGRFELEAEASTRLLFGLRELRGLMQRHMESPELPLCASDSGTTQCQDFAIRFQLRHEQRLLLGEVDAMLDELMQSRFLEPDPCQRIRSFATRFLNHEHHETTLAQRSLFAQP